MKPIIVTGLSGAGISSVLKTLEDFKFEVFDNFPISLIPHLYDEASSNKNIAIGIDTRTRGFSPEAILNITEEIDAHLLFITCDDTILQKRFTETRRRHPLAQSKSIVYGITKERELLEPIRDHADFIIDSTNISIHDLRHIIEGNFSIQSQENLTISLISFGFRNGIPREADIIMDVRFLRNPHWDTNLKPKTGLDRDVGEYISQDNDFNKFIDNFKNLLSPLLPRYAKEGKSYLTIGIGCTGGKHRSVFVAETLKKWLKKQDLPVFTEHRDIPKL